MSVIKLPPGFYINWDKVNQMKRDSLAQFIGWTPPPTPAIPSAAAYNTGDTIYHRASNHYGKIHGIREHSPTYIEYQVQWDTGLQEWYLENWLDQECDFPYRGVMNGRKAVMKLNGQVIGSFDSRDISVSHNPIFKNPECECGGRKADGLKDFVAGHSDWCPVHHGKKT